MQTWVEYDDESNMLQCVCLMAVVHNPCFEGDNSHNRRCYQEMIIAGIVH